MAEIIVKEERLVVNGLIVTTSIYIGRKNKEGKIWVVES